MRSKLQLDAKDFASGLDSASGKLSGFRRLMASASATAAGFLGASVIQRGIEGVKNQIGGIISAGSDLNETTSKTQQVFGDSFDAINKWASGSARAFGLSKQEALDTVSTYGAMAKAAGQSGGEAVKFGEDLVGAASDLGSFWNFDPSQVAADIQSGLAGESEPLRKYNIYLNETAVKAKAAEMGLVGSNGELTDENKILARKALIMEQLGPAAGDYARTQKGLANGTRTLTAYFKNFQAWLGGKIVPTVAKGVAWVNKLAGRFQRLREEGLSPTQALLKTLRIELYQVFGRGVLDAINAIAHGFVAVWGAVKLWGGSLIDAFRSGSKVSDLVEKFPKPLQGMAKGFLTIADAVGDAFAAFRSGGFSGLLDQLGPSIKQAVSGVGDLVKEFAGFAVDIGEWTLTVGLPKLGGWLLDMGGDLWGWVKGQLGIGGSGATGDGTGGPDTDRKVSVGSWLIDVPVPSLIGWISEWAGNLWGWVKKQLGVGAAATGDGTGGPDSDRTVDLGTVLISGFLKLAETVVFSDVAESIRTGVVSAVTALATLGTDIGSAIVDKITGIDWPTVITGDSFNVGVAFGAALRTAIGSAAEVASGLVGGFVDAISHVTWDDVVTGLKAALAAALAVPGVFAAVGVAIASAIGGTLAGLVFGPDVDFDSVVTKIKGGIQGAIDAATDWGDMLVGKGADLIGGLSGDIDTAVTSVLSVSVSGIVSAIITPFSTAGTWLEQAAKDVVGGLSDTISGDEAMQGVRDAISGVVSAVISPFLGASEWLVQAGRDAVQGLIDGATEKLGFLQGIVDSIKGIWNQIPLLGHSPWPMMIAAGKDAVDGLVIGGESRIPRLEKLMDNVMATVSIGPSMSAHANFSGSSALSAGGGAAVNQFFVLDGAIVTKDTWQTIQDAVANGKARAVDRRISSRGLGESY